MTQSAADPARTDAAALPSPKERRRLREARSLSEEQVAEAVGVTRATIKSWETGRTNPRGRKRDVYAKLLATYEEEIAAREATAAREEPAQTPEADAPQQARQTQQAQEPQPAQQARQVQRAQQQVRQDDDRTAVRRTAPTVSPSAMPARARPHAPARSAPGAGRRAPTVPAPPPTPSEGPAFTAEDAFDALYTETAPGLARQTYLLTGRRDLSLEAVEHAFHVAWQRWPEVAVDRDPASWVRAAAYEYAMSPWHKLRRSHRHPEDSGSPQPWPSLRETLLELPPTYRRTLILYDGLGLDLPDTAAETEASTPAAANRLLHARAAVAELLPELAEPEALQEELADLVVHAAAPEIAPADAVRAGSERRTRFWTRAAFGLTALILGAAALTMVVSDSHYEAPQAPGESVGGVRPAYGPPAVTKRYIELRTMLRHHPLKGPERLLPFAH
ncbi:sigma factor-like helix-turn-helix DNA-binding protein [Streptomyces sp. NPDC002133]|uniref:sigma factor-like helix-turn-helix DNA-binding protein n=1 Tax=Streptomyces sp. NPDC002133 TaxID=3154409 RepID=UPI00332B36A1